MKKLLLALAAVLMVCLVVIVSAPFFVDVDQYRPMIVDEANKKLNGKLELGKLKLSLLGAVKVEAERIKINVNGFEKPLVDTDRFALEIPFSSLLSGRPLVVAVLRAPKIDVEKNAAGEMNILKLMRTTQGNASVTNPAAAFSTTAQTEPVESRSLASTESVSAGKVPALLVGAKLGISIKKGDVNFTDAISKAKYAVEGLDLEARNLGFASTMELSFTAPLKGASPTMKFQGPVSGAAEITPMLVDGMVRSAKGKIEIDASKLALEMNSGMLKKPEGIAMGLKAIFDGTEKDLLVRSADVQFHEAKVNLKGVIETYPSLLTKLDMSVAPFRLERFHEVAPMTAQYGLKGLLQVNANAETDGVKHKMNGELKLGDGELFLADSLKAPLQIQAQLGFSENALNINRLSLSAPETELQVLGTITNFLTPQFSLSFSGKSLNLDKLLIMESKQEPKEQRALGLSLVPEARAEKNAKAKPVMANPMAAMASNPMLMGANGFITAQIGKLTVKGSPIESIQAKVQLQKLNVNLQQASAKLYGGSLNSTGSFDLKSLGLNFKNQGRVENISAKEAFTTYFPAYKNTLEGNMNAEWNVNGALYPETARVRLLKGTAKIKAENGILRTVDVQENINSAMDKVPFLKGKRVKVDDGFKLLSADIKFNDGIVDVNPILITPKGKGFEIKGKSRIEAATAMLEQESFLDVYDPQGQLPKEISKPGQVAIAIRVHGPLSSPKTDYEYTVKKLAGTAAKGAAKSVLQDLGKKFLGGAEKSDKPADAVKGLTDKLKKFKF